MISPATPSPSSNENLSNKAKSPNKIIFFTFVGLAFLIIVGVVIYFVWDNKQDRIDDLIETENHGTEQQTFIPIDGEISVRKNDSEYEIFTGDLDGWFETGQDADITLSSYGFNNSGGALSFNHQKGIATDGEHLLIADTRNNRILIWNELPEANTEPDIVLGQDNFIMNNPGDGMDDLRWPVGITTNGEQVAVADTYNQRILIWNTFPTENGQPADVVLETQNSPINEDGAIIWPWAVHIEATMLIVTSTQGKSVLIWNEIPTSNTSPDLVLKNDDFGTPRTIITDGTMLSIGDHNAFGNTAGNFVWNEFPQTGNEPYDYFITDPASIGDNYQNHDGSFMYGNFTEDGKYIIFDGRISIWNSFPESENVAPDFVIGSKGDTPNGVHFLAGDGSGVAYANGRLFLSSSNDNFVAVYNELPTQEDQEPDFVIGSSDLETNTLRRDFLITNPMPATNGESLFVVSDFERKMYVWKNLPDESLAEPDYIYNNVRGWDIALWENTLAVADQESVTIWEDDLPLGNLPTKTFLNNIGSANFSNLKGIALDDKYFYLADEMLNIVYIWEGIPDENDDPIFTIEVQQPHRIYSDGEYFAIVQQNNHEVKIYSVENLETNSEPLGTVGGMRNPGSPNLFNLPSNVLIFRDHIFVADTGFNQVKGWKNIGAAMAGEDPNLILGAESLEDTTAGIGQNKLMMPAGITYDGVNLWVSEFKFSGRILRFPPTTDF